MPFAGRAIAARFLGAVAALEGTAWIACVGLLLLLFLTPDRGPRVRRGSWALLLGLGLPAVAGLAWAWQLRWVADDAFITFRYAENLARGLGPVWNAGERVEGYTDPLWMALLSLAIRCGADPVRVSLVLSLASFVCSLALVRRIAAALPAGGPAPTVPPAVLLLATNYVFVSFATSGLETMTAATLALAALAAAIEGRPMTAGFAGIAATLMHPDHALLYAALGLALALERRGWRPLARYAVPFATVFVPFWLARWAYYGWPMPNTFYAKSSPGFYASEGGNYLLVSALGGGLAALLVVSVVAAARFRRTLLGRYYLAAFALLVVYILKIGGDFMLGRLLVALAPPAAILGELLLRDLAGRARALPSAFACAALLALGALPIRIVDPFEKAWGIADERSFYRLRTIHPLDMDAKYPGWGRTLRDRFGQASPPLTIGFDSIGIVGYLSRLRIVDLMGLTEVAVAHRPIGRRGRPGHERNASTAYLFDRHVDVANRRIYPPEYDPLSQIDLGEGLLVYRTSARSLPGAAREPEGAQHAIDTYDAAKKDPETVACDLWFFREFYFAHESDEPRWASLIERLGSAGALPPDVARYLERPGDAVRVGALEWKRDSVEIDGSAFADSPTTQAPLLQDEPRGYDGPFLDTFTAAAGDAAEGSLRSRPFEIVGDVMVMHVGGGKDSASLSVRLVVDGKAVASSTGCGSDMLGERVWATRAWRGQTGYVEVVDRSTVGWGHVMVDGIVQWTLPH